MSKISNHLIVHFKLKENFKDDTGNCNHVENKSVKMHQQGAIFNGRDSHLEVPHNNSLKFGQGEFSVSVWIHTEKKVDDNIGDIICKYDSKSRSGFNLSVMNHAGVVFSHANCRNIHFGIDNSSEPEWSDCGRLGNCVFVMGLIVHKGKLYGSSLEIGNNEYGHLYRYEGGQNWFDCGHPDKCNCIAGMVAYNGDLYVATAHHDAHGSLLPSEKNINAGGSVFCYTTDGKWFNCGRVSDEEIHGLVVFEGQLYAYRLYEKGFYRYEGGKKWTVVEGPESKIMAAAAYNGSLYCTANRLSRLTSEMTHAQQKVIYKHGVYRFDGTKWHGCGTQEDATQIYSLTTYEGKLYVGTWPRGTVYRYEGDTRWTNCGRLDQEQEVMGLNIYNGKLYTGTLPSANVYRYDDGVWSKVGQVDQTPAVPFHRAWSMAVYDGKLFVGTLPSGHVHSMEAGKNVTYDYQLSPGWQHLTAVKDKASLKLYVNGKLVKSSSEFDQGRFNFLNEAPLRIGFGSHDYFNGTMRDLRIYKCALNDAEVLHLYKSSDDS